MSQPPSPEPPGAEELHPLITVADKVGAKVAEHVTKAAKENAQAETERRQAHFASILTGIYETSGPAVRDALAPIMPLIPDDHPLRKTLEAIQSPTNPFEAAMLDIAGMIGLVMAILPTLGKILVEPLANAYNAEYPNVVLPPDIVAALDQQNFDPTHVWSNDAAQSGIDVDRYLMLYYLAGDAPPPQMLFEMFRRNIIGIGSEVGTELSVKQGLRQGRTRDTWVDYVAQLAHVWPTPIDFVNAAVREQIPYDVAARWAAATGLDLSQDPTTPPINATIGNSAGPGTTGSFFDVLFDVAVDRRDRSKPPTWRTGASSRGRGAAPR